MGDKQAPSGAAGSEEHKIIRSQLRFSATLILGGAVAVIAFKLTGVLDGNNATAAFGLATAIIGAGAAMLPTGAAAGASARILRALPDNGAGNADTPARLVDTADGANGSSPTGRAKETARTASSPDGSSR